jgi:purine nucleosidase
MFRLLPFCLIVFFIAQLLRAGHAQSIEQEPVSVILDTDMDSDVDDVGALAMLHAYERQKRAHILGIIVTSDEKYRVSWPDIFHQLKAKNRLRNTAI